ncbi:NADPH:quinone oxidoreductase family protein [Azospirillum sp. INR13]|uniref:NADPH:quinone oxidoreductase family protein n=1 Tax=Azospirillum sp. INR13 TaxID=2596919 RepID=UPI0018925E3E|nr:NADPH:quinone oxidoreductase family protein [Azospirillum sp. INR13]MBF5096105.1 NADPH:quinone oxidoreductase family protein [Azospirillum sp. INR13]
MKALHCLSYGEPPELRIVETVEPAPGPGEALIAVEAVGIGGFDAVLLGGRYQERPEPPFVPGRELAGRVLAVGEGGDPALIGMRVAAISFKGALAERAVARCDHCLATPPDMDPATAASILSAYATSLYALETCGRMTAGETVLVLGGAGTVGAAAIDIARGLGGRVVAAASTTEKLEFCRSRGAELAVDYGDPHWRRAMTERLGGGIDLVVDPVGGTLSEPAFRSLAPGGRHLVVGFAAGEIPRIPLNLPLLKRASIVGVDWGGFMQTEPAANRALLDRLRDLFDSGTLRPVQPTVHPLSALIPLLDGFRNRRIVGKPVIQPDFGTAASARSIGKQQCGAGHERD